MQEIYKGAAANDKTGTPARTAAQIINDNFAYLDAKITRKDSIVVSTGYAGTPEDKIMNIYWEWIIDAIDYTNPAPVPLNFPYAASGKMRLDMIALTTSNTAIRIAGPESDSNPVSAPLPDNMIQAGIVLVTDSEVGDPSSPIIGDTFVKKLESQDVIVNYGATTVIEQINLTDERSSISLIGSVTDVKSVQVSGLYIRMGKPHFVKNRTGHDVKLWHLEGTGNIKYFFPNGLDLIVKPNEVISFNTNSNDSANVRFEYVGGATAVTGAMTYKGTVANYAALPSTGLTVGDVYNLTDTGHNYAWSGSVWDDLGPAVDVSGKEDVSNKSNAIETDKASTTKYGNIAAWIFWLVTYFFPNITAKATPILADSVMLGDSADSNKTKKSTLQTIRDLFKSFFDTIYAPKSDVYSKIVYVNASTPATATIFDLNNPPTTNDNSLKIDVNNLYIGTDASTWVYNSSSSSYTTKTVVLNSNTQIEVGTSQNAQAIWNGATVIFTANCTITIPASLTASYIFNGMTLSGVTVTWAITSPHTWGFGTPTPTIEKQIFTLTKRGNTNSILLLPPL
jgi:hypothetical protein